MVQDVSRSTTRFEGVFSGYFNPHSENTRWNKKLRLDGTCGSDIEQRMEDDGGAVSTPCCAPCLLAWTTVLLEGGELAPVFS